MIELPVIFATRTAAREGPRGRTWLDELPELVALLLSRWACEVADHVTHGEVGLVVPVRRRTGEPAVLKLAFPHPGNVGEPHALAAWRGDGAVLLYERDDERFAMLLERAETTSLRALGGTTESVALAGQVHRQLSITAPADWERLSDQADGWAEQLFMDNAELAHPLPQHVVDAAVQTVRDLARSQPQLAVHGDFHFDNILRAQRQPWLAIDPKGYQGDPAYDGGAVLKGRFLSLLDAGDPDGLLARPKAFVEETLQTFADAAGLDLLRVQRWAQLYFLQLAFWGRRHGFSKAREGPELADFVAAADRLTMDLTEITLR